MQEFDVTRAILLDKPFAPPMHDPTVLPLATVMATDTLRMDERCLVATFDDQTLVMELLSLVYYHTAQGILDGRPWMVSFCLICNAGSCFSPMIEATHHHFTANGIYNGMSLLKDQETGSIWHHMTGECLYGERKGARLRLISSMHHMTASQALAAYPQAWFVETPMTGKQQDTALRWEKIRQDPRIELDDPDSAATLGVEDTRLSRLEAGVGVIVGDVARFYPIRALNAHDNFVIDTLGERTVLVYICPHTLDPHAYFIEATSAEWRGDNLYLSNGESVKGATLYDADGNLKATQRPLHHYQRWYSFAFTYPIGDVFQSSVSPV